MERRDECIEMLKEIKNSLEEVIDINATFIRGISCDSVKFVIDQAISIIENENSSNLNKQKIEKYECRSCVNDNTLECLRCCGKNKYKEGGADCESTSEIKETET